MATTRLSFRLRPITRPKALAGVPGTLEYLASRHRMILFTRGESAEQAAKVERSGLQGFFEAIEIVPEKSLQEIGRAHV